MTKEKEEYKPEASISGVPKNFVISCLRCRWSRITSGVTADITDLHEMNLGCVNCGKWRKFKCPKCGIGCPMKRIKGNT
jgi:hypothetical protein